MIRCLIRLPKCVAICVTFGRGRAPALLRAGKAKRRETAVSSEELLDDGFGR
jgi:hypothetical protein